MARLGRRQPNLPSGTVRPNAVMLARPADSPPPDNPPILAPVIARGAGPAPWLGASAVIQTARTTGPYVAAQFATWQSDGGGNGFTLTVTGALPGDQLFVCVTDSQSATPPTPPVGAGFADVQVSDNTSGTNFEAFYYLLSNPANTTYTWGVTGGRRTIGGLLIRGGVFENGDVLETASSTSHLSPTVPSAGPDRLAVAMLVLRGFPTSAWAENQAGSWDERVQAVGGDAVTNMQVSAQNKPVGAGNVSDTFTCATAEPAIVGIFVFGPGNGNGHPVGVAPAAAPPKPAGTATVISSRSDPSGAPPPETLTVPVMSLGTTRPAVGTSALLGPRVEETPPPRTTIAFPNRPVQPATQPGAVWLTAPRTDPATAPDTPCPAPLVASRPIPAVSGSSVLSASRSEPPTQTDSPPRPLFVTPVVLPKSGSTFTAAQRFDAVNDVPAVPRVITPTTRLISGGAVITATRDLPTDAPAPVTLVVTQPLYRSAGQSALLRPVTEPPIIVPSELVGRPVIVSAGWRVTVGNVVYGRLTHSCVVPRPFGGITPRPATGTTVYGLSTTARPDTGVTARPDTGTTESPC